MSKEIKRVCIVKTGDLEDPKSPDSRRLTTFRNMLDARNYEVILVGSVAAGLEALKKKGGCLVLLSSDLCEEALELAQSKAAVFGKIRVVVYSAGAPRDDMPVFLYQGMLTPENTGRIFG